MDFSAIKDTVLLVLLESEIGRLQKEVERLSEAEAFTRQLSQPAARQP